MKSIFCPIAVWMLVALALVSGKSMGEGDASGEAVLKAKGLSRVGSKYLLEADAGLADWLRQVRASEKKVRGAMHRRMAVERDISSMEATANSLYTEWLDQKQVLAEMNKGVVFSYNAQVDRVNALRAKILSLLDAIKGRVAALQVIGDPGDEYVAITMKFGSALDAAMEKYKALADDQQVRSALETINKASGAKFTLGPSDRLKTEWPDIQKLRDQVNTDTINFEFHGGVPTVPITLNGTVSVPAIVDSGAAALMISDKVAGQLGLVPGPKDHVIHMVTADGSINEVHMMMLKSVRLGKFTVQDVECLVQPSHGKEIDTLLGGTFLRRFVYRMDLSAGQLRLSQIIEKPAGPNATTRPAAGRPAQVSTMPPQPASVPDETAGAPPAKTSTAGTIDLLAKIDPSKDTLIGKFESAGGGLTIHDGNLCEAQLGGKFPPEYDLNVSFLCKSLLADSATLQIQLPLQGQLATFGLQLFQDHYLFGFWESGKRLESSRSVARVNDKLAADVPYQVVLKVRHGSVRGVLNGQPIYTLSSFDRLLRLPEDVPLIGVEHGTGVIREIRLKAVAAGRTD
jgi:clan AA aspartic protease (TIGR02281 family)